MKNLFFWGIIVALLSPGLAMASQKDITISADGTSGSWFIAGAAFQDAFGQNIRGSKFSVVPGGGAANPIRVHRNDAQVGFTYATTASAAFRGVEAYKGKKAEKLRTLVNLQILQHSR